MSDPRKQRPENAPSNFYVDSTCIDCGACYWVAPKTFREVGGQSAVYSPSVSPEEREAALAALFSCPVGSIGTHERDPLQAEVAHSFPRSMAPGVYHCGFHSEDSFGASSYLIVREGGNVLVDSPRFLPQLVKAIQKLGGVRYQYLTHKDDVADTDRYHEVFGSERIIHRGDVNARTAKYERVLEGDADHRLAEDLLIIPVPGHTRGHTALLWKDQFLFTGDHLCWDPEAKRLMGFKNACWYDWNVQLDSFKRLLGHHFSHVLPGHGDPWASSDREMHQSLQDLCQREGAA